MAKHAAYEEPEPIDLVFESRCLTETEIAAVTAVLTAAAREQQRGRAALEARGVSRWASGQRSVRFLMRRGSWRSFGV